MEITTTPWDVFRSTLKTQQMGTLDNWLRHWLFTDKGVIFAAQETVSPPCQPPSAAVSAAR